MKIKILSHFLRYFLFIFLLVQILLYGCATVKEKEPVKAEKTEEPVKTEVKEIVNSVSIKVMDKVFSPNNDKISDDMAFKIVNNSPDSNPVVSWNLTIYNSNNKDVFKNQKNDKLPEEFIWNGKSNDNQLLADGMYYATLEVDFVNGTTPKAKTDSFYIDTTPPKFAIQKNYKYFSPDNDGFNDVLTFDFVNAEDMSGIKSWKLAILYPAGKKEFAVFSGNGKPEEKITWDGKSKDGKLVESAEEYPVEIISEDIIGNKVTKKSDPVIVDILVEKLGDGRYKIRINNIKFKPDLPIMTDNKKNIEILNNLTEALKKFPDHKILIEGYANRWRDKLSEEKGYELSRDRAILISNELNKRGIKMDRMSVKGRGFEEPIIHLRENMTYEEKLAMEVNRRVEFYLER